MYMIVSVHMTFMPKLKSVGHDYIEETIFFRLLNINLGKV